jgi:hypothetical protein
MQTALRECDDHHGNFFNGSITLPARTLDVRGRPDSASINLIEPGKSDQNICGRGLALSHC